MNVHQSLNSTGSAKVISSMTQPRTNTDALLGKA